MCWWNCESFCNRYPLALAHSLQTPAIRFNQYQVRNQQNKNSLRERIKVCRCVSLPHWREQLKGNNFVLRQDDVCLGYQEIWLDYSLPHFHVALWPNPWHLISWEQSRDWISEYTVYGEVWEWRLLDQVRYLFVWSHNKVLALHRPISTSK